MLRVSHPMMMLEDIPNSFSCDDCGLKFIDISNFRNHRLSHHENLKRTHNSKTYKGCYSCPLCPNWWSTEHLGIRQLICTDNLFKCVICPKLFFTESDFRKHSKTHIKIIDFPCSMCRKRFSNRVMLDKHKNKVHSRTNRFFSCDFCPKVFERPSNLKYHRRTHIANDRLSCTHCSRKFCRTGDLNRHIGRFHTKSGGAQHRCKICKKIFANAEYLAKHEVNHSESRIQCVYCNRKLISQPVLNRHIKNVHLKNIQNLTCTFCKEVFIQLADLRKHQKACTYNATTTQKFECDQCRKQFVCKRNLKHHLNLHTNLSPHICELCQKKFTSRSNLKEHRKIHMRLCSDFECEFCSKRFSTESEWLNHRNVHADKKQLQCDLCLKVYEFPSLLKRHLKRAHKILDIVKMEYESS